MLTEILNNKPALVGLHLGLAIIGIDSLLWLLGEYAAGFKKMRRAQLAAIIGAIGFIGSWIFGGFYYVKFYGKLVKPIILKGSAPWAHGIAMEVKEHVFLLLIPAVLTLLIAMFVKSQDLKNDEIKKPLMAMIFLIVAISFAIGLMGFIISSAARWA